MIIYELSNAKRYLHEIHISLMRGCVTILCHGDGWLLVSGMLIESLLRIAIRQITAWPDSVLQ